MLGSRVRALVREGRIGGDVPGVAVCLAPEPGRLTTIHEHEQEPDVADGGDARHDDDTKLLELPLIPLSAFQSSAT